MKKILIILGVAFLFSASLAFGDIGPKPTIDLELTYNNGQLTDSIFYADLLACYEQQNMQYKDEPVNEKLDLEIYDSEKNCSWCPARTTWGGEGSNGKCDFSYFLPQTFKIAIYLPSMDKVFISEEISRINFYSTYSVNLLPDGSVEVVETTSFLLTKEGEQVQRFIMAYVLTLFFELFGIVLYLAKNKFGIQSNKKRIKIFLTVLLLNSISLPIIWFVFTLSGLHSFYILIIGEIFAVLFEGYFLHAINKDIFTIKKSMMISLILNGISLFIGGFFYACITMF